MRTRHPLSLDPTGHGTVATSWPIAAGESFELHRHQAHQLSVAAHGAIAMGVADRTWVLPRSRALWVPAGTWHSVTALGADAMQTLWLVPERCPITWEDPTVVEVDDLVLRLIDRLLDRTLGTEERTRSEAVLFDVLTPLEIDVVELALPADDRARRVAEALLADPADGRSLEAWGREVGASDRTLARAFVAGTGMGFQEWRTRARVAAALRLLLTDRPITAIATDVGYTTTSAFSAAFRRMMGVPPSAYRAGRGGRAGVAATPGSSAT